MQLLCLRAVRGCHRGTKPLDGLQLPPAVTELAEHRQAPLGEPPRGGTVAADHRYLGVGAQRRRDSPLVALRPEVGKSAAEQRLGH